jgi:D-alanyl-lipoteichoic acid acyltransferase DltB (MBOAT superfamily)
MLFNSIQFLSFFFIVIVTYFVIPYRYRWFLLLCASYIFYASFNPGYIPLLFGLALINYYAALRISDSRGPAERKGYLIFCLLSNIMLLLMFKYYNFFTQSLTTFFGQYSISFNLPALRWLLPVGISFYIFKNMSYAIDVYRGDKTPERHLGFYALYVAFFPQLLAGPIERSTRLIPQLHKKFDFDYARVTRGLKFVLWGLFMKIVIADTLTMLVDPVYSSPRQYDGMHLMLATFFYAFQIYCDFAGYSHIAIGAAEVFGYKTMQNFDHPYVAQSIADFWRRWHISLSTWLRDYLYIPLGGNRVSASRRYFNLFIVFLLCGLWHGANWTFIVWGGIHGLYLIFSLMTRGIRNGMCQMLKLNEAPRIHKVLKMIVTFSLASFAWIFFRANNISDALYISSHLTTQWENVTVIAKSTYWGSLRFEFIIGMASLILLFIAYQLQRRADLIQMLSRMPIWFRWSVYYAAIVAILLCGNIGAKPFIYFQF